MKKILLIMLLASLNLFSQKVSVLLGDEEYLYDIYSSMYGKAKSDPPKPLCLLKDGRTIATEINQKENYYAYYIFDANHKLQKIVKPVLSHFPDIVRELHTTIVCGDKIVFLIKHEKDGQTAVMYRCIADLNSGNILSEEKLEEFSSDDDVEVLVDKINQSYAILRSTKNGEKRTSRFLHFNNKSQLLYQASYNHYKNEQYINGVLLGDKCAIITFYEKSRLNSSHVSLVKFDSKDQRQMEKEIDYPEPYTPSYTEMHVNPQQNKLLITYYLMVNAKRNVVTHTKTLSFDIMQQLVDVDDFSFGKLFVTPNAKVNDYVVNKLQIKEGNTGDGFPIRCAIDSRGNAIILKSQDPEISISALGISTHEPDIIGVSLFDMTGKETGGYAIRQRRLYGQLDIFCTKKWNYIITHDQGENYVKTEIEKQKSPADNGKDIIIAYYLDNGQVKKTTPNLDGIDEKYRALSGYFLDCNPDTGQAVGVVYDKKIKHYRFAWITLE